ncbi:MAG: ATP-dependent helicase HrpB [Prevotella sp.]|nr:ATP-dependent helicase HrpB [Prevotella sp.]
MTDRLQRELESLPVAAVAARLNDVLREHTAAIVTAAPGAGKSTVLPLTVLETLQQDGEKIVVLEPRRVAARQIASRMAWLLNEPVGQTVGYRIRFENKTSDSTRIEVVTEGVLTRMLLDDPTLENVAVVMFDEFHERSINTDEAFALTRQCQQLLRDDLRLLVMSATIDAAPLAEALRCPVLESKGRIFPVKVVHADEEADPHDVPAVVARTILQAHRRHEGDILAFLPGEAEIRHVQELLSTAGLAHTAIFPLYGMLGSDEQTRAIAPSRTGERKIVLATPIAETSLTIEGVRVVVDSGLCRKVVFDTRSGLNHLQTVRISADMAAQRTGRAGRVAPGTCYRLWTAATEARMSAVRTPEILEADLTSLVLDAAIWGERQPESLPWLTPPPKAALCHAKTLLTSLGAIDATGRATAWGKKLSHLPCHPRIAQMLLSAGRTDQPRTEEQTAYSQRSLAADIAALLDEKDPLGEQTEVSLDLRLDALRRQRSSGRPGRWAHIANAARQYAGMIHAAEDNSPVNPYEVGALLAAAYPERIAKAWKEGVGVFQLSGGGLVAVEASDALSGAQWIAVASMHQKPGGVGKAFLASVVSPADLKAYASERDVTYWDGKAGALVARRETRIGTVLLATTPLSSDVRQEAQRVICEAIVKDGTSMLHFSDDVQNMLRRIAFVSARHPELALPTLDVQAVCQSATQWGPLFVGKATTASELKKIDLTAVVWSLLSYEQQQAIERIAPTHIVVPTGSRIRLDFRLGAEAPVLRVRLQECFGLLDTPLVDGQPVLMELLSPGFKPIQLTTDLRSFWQTTYFDVRKELRRRYPKHAWPDKPLEAAPVRGVKR